MNNFTMNDSSRNQKKKSTRWLKLLCLSFMICIGQISFAQSVNDYGFTQTQETYTPITDGTVLWEGYDGFDDQTSSISLTTPFNYLGTNYSSVFVSANGYVLFGSTSTTNTPISSGRFGVAGFSVDLDAKSAASGAGTPSVRWKLIGDELVVQWENVCRWGTSGAGTTEVLNFQIRLNTSNSEIKIVYGNCQDRVTPLTTYPQVGLAGGNTSSFKNRTIAAGEGDWINSIAGTANNLTMAFNGTTIPSNGLTFTWTLGSCLTPVVTPTFDSTTTSTTVNLGDYNSTVDVKWGALNFNVETEGTLISDFENGDQISGLTASTNYHIYFRKNCDNNEISNWSGPYSFSTACDLFDAINENFDSLETGSSTNPTKPNCWSTLFTGTGYGYASGTYAASGNRSFYLYNSSDNSGSNLLISPETNALGNGTMRVKFKIRFGGTTNYTAIFGTMSDNTDAATFTPIQTITSENSSSFTEYTIDIPAGTDNYFAFKHGLGGTYRSIYIDDVIYEPIPSCNDVNGFALESLTPSSATLNWNTVGTNFEIRYGLQGFELNSGTTAYSTTNSVVLNSLNEGTTYQAYIRQICNETEFGNWSNPILFTTYNSGQIGIGTTTSTNFPISTNWGYNYTQQIFTQSQISAVLEPGSNYITKIKFFWNGTSASTPSGTIDSANCDAWTVYLGNTSQNEFSTTNSWIPNSELQEVFTGNVVFPAAGNWMEIEFDTPFIWNETQNLVLAVSEREYGYPGTSYFRSFTSGTNTGMYVRTDTSPGTSTDPLNPGAGTRSNILNQITITAIPIPSCIPPVQLTVEGTLFDRANLSWTSNATAFDLEYGPTGFTPGTGTVIQNITNPYQLTGLTQETSYDFYVRSYCEDNEFSPWAGPKSFTTTEACPTPSLLTHTQQSMNSSLLSWSSAGNQFELVWGIQGFNHTTATPISVTGNFYLADNLTTDANYQYYVRLNCTEFNNGTSAWAGPFNFSVGYCIPTYTSGGSTDNITNVVLEDLMDIDLPTGTPYYYNRTATQNTIPNLTQGSTYSIYIKFGTNSSQYSRVWIDFNNDGVFGSNESFSTGTSAGTSGTAEISFTVPTDSNLGQVRLRVRGGEDSAILATQACGASSSGFGRAIDYVVNIVENTANTDEFESTKIKAFPNPVTDVLTISSNNQINSVSIYNLLGQVVKRNNVSGEQINININELPSGNYLVKVTSEKSTQTIKIVKK